MKTIEQIAAELQGYDPQALPAADVARFLSLLVTPVTDRLELPLFEALGRVLAEDVVSPFNVPPHDNSAMDGYAFAGAALAEGGELQLKVVGTALAGKAWQGTVAAGECLKIMTGAIMPAGLDTVVPQEFVSVQGDSITVPAKLLTPGDNRRLRGEDLMQGRAALSKGELLTPARLGLLASLGMKTVPVLRPLRVAYFSTGDEILSLGELPREGAVYDSNRYTVFGMLRRLGCEVIDMGVVRDEPVLLEAAFISAAALADAIITSGGVSVGEADYTKAMMKKLGDVAFWRVAMRPGRPMAVGRISQAKSASSPFLASADSYQTNSNPNGAILFGLPGNPVAVMVTFLAFVRPALLQMMGCSAPHAPLLRACSVEAIRKKPGRTEYQRGTVNTASDGSLQVRTTGNQGSGVLSSMAQANGLIVLHHGQGNVAVGEDVDVMMFDGWM
ncbi:molybdopterin molybdotransferase MoeA [Polaromonas eurypsychrophila]|uniref:Molybdopterin molybdenumtransferase n=1 Tax=Polaromonas eurypsychrophila TaxID=1614635 RepID=A0A916WGW0_9BURK|nr:gephyrin-like molybdotransferase Glp [Polaromonas eurypsychrophila]GGB00010.1 molybdopterin molybdenumtransferase MoeA [Polaromonas eurypsychrophila]